MREMVGCLLMSLLSGVNTFAGVSSVTGLGAWAGHVSEYANPFDTNLDRNPSESTLTSDSAFAAARPGMVVSRSDARGAAAHDLRMTKSGTSGTATWVEYVAPASFQVGTVLTYQAVYSGFTGTMPFAVQTSNGEPADWSTVSPVQGTPTNATGPGTAADYLIRLTTTSSVSTADRFRLAFSSTAIYSGTSYADFNEVTILPDRLKYVTPTTVSASGGTSAATAFNLKGGADGDGWYQSGAGTKWLKASFGVSQQIDALVLYSWDNMDGNMTIVDGFGNNVASVTMTNVPEGWVLPIKLDHSLITTDLYFNFTNTTSSAGIREIVLLQDIPEPASLSLLALGGLALLRRRRKLGRLHF